MTALLEVRDLRKYFPVRSGLLRREHGAVRAVDGVSFDLAAGETLGIVGESGCGKSTLGRLVLRLIEPTAGTVRFAGADLLRARRASVAPHGGARCSSSSRIRSARSIRACGSARSSARASRSTAWRAAPSGARACCELLERVGLRADAFDRYPHEFSGGQRQRIGIARALAVEPRLIVADEPVSALDVSIQAQIVNLLQDLQDELGLAYLFIAHDLRVVEHISHRVAIMYLGRIVELADSRELYANPHHPYTRALLSAVPELDPQRAARAHRAARRSAEPDQPAGRVPLPPALCVRRGALPQRGADAAGTRRPPGRVSRVSGVRRRRSRGDLETPTVETAGRAAAATGALSTSAPPADFLAPPQPLRATLDQESDVSGKLSFSGPTRIDGRLRGEVRGADLLVIGESGCVNGTIRATTLVVLGRVDGDVVGAERVEIGPQRRAARQHRDARAGRARRRPARRRLPRRAADPCHRARAAPARRVDGAGRS